MLEPIERANLRLIYELGIDTDGRPRVADVACAYSTLESAWPYQDIQEVQLGAVSDLVLVIVVIPGALFAMGLFFLISGLVTYGSLSRKGPRVFARDRVVRLGVPLLLWTLLVWPGVIWISHRAAGQEQTFWDQLLVDSDPFLDPGPMWFVEVLLLYSLAYGRGGTR